MTRVAGSLINQDSRALYVLSQRNSETLSVATSYLVRGNLADTEDQVRSA